MSRHVRLAALALAIASSSGLAQGQAVRMATPEDGAHCRNLLGKENPFETEHLSDSDRSDLEFCRMSDTLDGVEVRLSFRDRHFEFWRGFRRQAIPLWFDMLDTYCEFHASAQYVDLFRNVGHCPDKPPAIHTSREKLTELFNQRFVLATNFLTFVNGQNAEAGSRTRRPDR